MEYKKLEVKIHVPKKEGDNYYVYLYDKEAQKIVKKFYKGLNVYSNANDCLSAAEDMQKALRLRLNNGYVPKTKHTTLPKFEVQEIDIIKSLNFSIESMENRLERKTVL